MLQQQTMSGAVARSDVRAIGAVHAGEQRIASPCFCVHAARVRRRDAERLAHLVTGGAGAAVAAEALEEGIRRVRSPRGVERRDKAAGIREGLQIRPLIGKGVGRRTERGPE